MRIIDKLGITDGPWKKLEEEVDKSYIRIRGTALGGRYKIANVMTPSYESVHEREAKETRANATLIAAAPEMLEALINIGIYGALKSELDWDKIQPVIEKATGKSWEKIKQAIQE